MAVLRDREAKALISLGMDALARPPPGPRTAQRDLRHRTPAPSNAELQDTAGRGADLHGDGRALPAHARQRLRGDHPRPNRSPSDPRGPGNRVPGLEESHSPGPASHTNTIPKPIRERGEWRVSRYQPESSRSCVGRRAASRAARPLASPRSRSSSAQASPRTRSARSWPGSCTIAVEVLRIIAVTTAISHRGGHRSVGHRCLIALVAGSARTRSTGSVLQAGVTACHRPGQSPAERPRAWPAAAMVKCSGPMAPAAVRAAGLPGMPARPAGRVIAMARSSARNPARTLRTRWTGCSSRCIAAPPGSIWRFRTELAALTRRQPLASGNWTRAVAATWTVVILTVSAVVITVLPSDPAAGHPPGVLHAVPAPHPPGLLRDPDAHQVRAAPPGAAHLPHRGRGTRGDLVPGRDLRRGFRS